jgi:hypothetical protein
MTSKDNISAAVRLALRHKKRNKEIRRFLEDVPQNTESVRNLLLSGDFSTSRYRHRTIFEPKMRELSVLPFSPDRIVHHALMNIAIPIWDKMFITDSYACRQGYGLHKASAKAMEFVRRKKYCLQCDIRRFYPNIRHDVMMNCVKKKIRDGKVLGVMENIIESVPNPGMPIGNFCSQWFGNLYLHEMDMFVKHSLGVKEYLRYADDFCLFSNDKKQLGEWREKLREFLGGKLRLMFSYAEIMPTADGIDFCGYRHFPGYVKMRKNTLIRQMRRMRVLSGLDPGKICGDDHLRGQLASLVGWCKHARNGVDPSPAKMLHKVRKVAAEIKRAKIKGENR